MNHKRLQKYGTRIGLILFSLLYKLSQTIIVQHIPTGIGVMQGTSTVLLSFESSISSNVSLFKMILVNSKHC